MPHAIIRRTNGQRHEVDFGDAPVRVQIYASEETIEIFVEADFEMMPHERRRIALLNIPRHHPVQRSHWHSSATGRKPSFCNLT